MDALVSSEYSNKHHHHHHAVSLFNPSLNKSCMSELKTAVRVQCVCIVYTVCVRVQDSGPLVSRRASRTHEWADLVSHRFLRYSN